MERVHTASQTDTGLVRSNNEDTYRIINGEEVLLLVCDGMGGAKKGEVASERAVGVICEETPVGSSFPHQNAAAQCLREAMRAADLRISNEAKADPSKYGMGTTATAMITSNNYLIFGQVGDSRGYVLRGNRLVQVTRDQTLIQDAIDRGQVTEEDARQSYIRHVIHQALGKHDGHVKVVLSLVELRRGDIVLLCSDGLNGMLRDQQIHETIIASLPDLDNACQMLIKRANDAGGADNTTVVLAQFNGEHLALPSAEDIALLRRQELVLPIT